MPSGHLGWGALSGARHGVSGAGGTYFLCGAPDAATRPVLYADSEGQATLIGADLVEAITLVVVLPYWRDLAKGFSLSELGRDVRAHQPAFEAERDRLLDALGLAPASEEDAAARLLAIAASTAPHYVPYVPADGYEPYELLFGQSDQWRQRQNGWPAGSA